MHVPKPRALVAEHPPLFPLLLPPPPLRPRPPCSQPRPGPRPRPDPPPPSPAIPQPCRSPTPGSPPQISDPLGSETPPSRSPNEETCDEVAVVRVRIISSAPSSPPH